MRICSSTEFFTCIPCALFPATLVTLEFRFKVVRVPDSLEEDENFPYEDEIFLVNVGETGKFTSDKIFQSKFTVFKDGGDLCCNGYAPDFARKSNVIEGRFAAGQSYRVKLTLTKYRVYVEINGGQFKTSYGNGGKRSRTRRFMRARALRSNWTRRALPLRSRKTAIGR